MTVRELIEQLEAVEDKSRVVIMQKDPEGNGYSPLELFDDSDDLRYRAETTWSGTVGHAELTDELERQGYGEEDIISDGQPAVVLVPVN